jgi:hypothetical protein
MNMTKKKKKEPTKKERFVEAWKTFNASGKTVDDHLTMFIEFNHAVRPDAGLSYGQIKELMNSNSAEKASWVQTDDLEFVRKESEDEYTIIEAGLCVGGQFIVLEVFVDLEKLTDRDLEDYIKDSDYTSLELFKDMHGEDWKQHMAIFITLQSPLGDEFEQFDGENEVIDYLKNHYGIEVA